MWAFGVLKVAVNMAHTQTMHATSVVLWWCRLLGTTTIVVVIVDVNCVVVGWCVAVVVVDVVGGEERGDVMCHT